MLNSIKTFDARFILVLFWVYVKKEQSKRVLEPFLSLGSV